MSYERDNITRLEAYVPGEQPEDASVVKLNTNENPYPPTSTVIDAIRTIDGEALRRYPPPSARAFRETAAEAHGVAPGQVIATNGGDELLRLAVTVFTEPNGHGGGVGLSSPTYSLYQVLADIHGASITTIPRRDDFSLPDDFAERLNDAGCRLAFVVNPHAPSGHLEPVETLESIARRFNGVLLVDEAYVDFAENDAIELLDESRGLDNVLLLRTLSKGYSLAGIRFGYGIGSRGLIATLEKARDSYNVDVVAQAAAVAALASRDEAAKSWRAVVDERVRLTEELESRGYSVLPSQTNFVLASPPSGMDNDSDSAASVYQSLKDRNVFVRYFDQDRLRDKLRITVGSREQNDALLAALGEI